MAIYTTVDELNDVLEKRSSKDCRQFVHRKLGELDARPLNVGVIGRPGVGKTSFIGSIGRLMADGPSLMSPCQPERRFAFHELPPVDDGTLWSKYVDDVDLEQFDFFVLLSESRDIDAVQQAEGVLMNLWNLSGPAPGAYVGLQQQQQQQQDRAVAPLVGAHQQMAAAQLPHYDQGRGAGQDVMSWLAREVFASGRKLYFVQTKIDVDVAADRKIRSCNDGEQSPNAVVEKARQNVDGYLRLRAGLTVPTFVVDNLNPDKYDFAQLYQCLVQDVQLLKRWSLRASLGSAAKDLVRKRAEEMRWRQAWVIACGAVAAVLPLGIEVAVAICIVLSEAKFFYRRLGLDTKSLERMAEILSADARDMYALVARKFDDDMFSVRGIQLLASCYSGLDCAFYFTLVQFARWVPFVGFALAALLGVYVTNYMIERILYAMEKTAINVVDVTLSSELRHPARRSPPT